MAGWLKIILNTEMLFLRHQKCCFWDDLNISYYKQIFKHTEHKNSTDNWQLLTDHNGWAEGTCFLTILYYEKYLIFKY